MNKSGIVLSFLSAAILIGCGSDDASTTTSNQSPSTDSSPTTYTFIDEPVKGLYYKSATQAGCTNESGHYKAMPTESVEFYIGVCDENNEATLADQSVLIGLVDAPKSSTTPYHLQISSSNTTSVNPITVATILKSFNFSSDTGKLDLSGLLLNENGVDNRNTLKGLIEAPSTDATTVLNTSLFNDIKLANRDINKNFVKTAFLDEATVKSELASTLSDSDAANKFSAAAIAGKTVVMSDSTVLKFATNYTELSGGYSSYGTVSVSTSSYDNVEWGIYSVVSGEDWGKLHINDGAGFDKTIEAISLGSNFWVVSVNGAANEVWTVKE